jgi:hypothetical protein
MSIWIIFTDYVLLISAFFPYGPTKTKPNKSKDLLGEMKIVYWFKIRKMSWFLRNWLA